MKTFLQLSLLLVFALPTMAQREIELRVVNKNTNEPVAFAHATFDSIRGAIFNERGELTLIITDEQATQPLIISCIGYRSQKVWLDLSQTQQIVRLEPIAIELPEIVINPDHWRVTQIGNTRRVRRTVGGGFLLSAGCQIALLVQTPNRDNFLQNIHFFIRRDGHPQEKFRAIIYRVDKETGLPGEVAIESNIILSGETGHEWVSYDVSRFGITVPEEGLFIAMEWLPESAERSFYEGTRGTTEIITHGQRLGGYTLSRGFERHERTVAQGLMSSRFHQMLWGFSRVSSSSSLKLIPFIRADVIERQ